MTGADPRVLIVGCGGIGGVIAANLNDAGVTVDTVARSEAVVDAIKTRGFRVVGEGSPRAAFGPIHLGVPIDGQYDVVLLATQPTDVEEAARQAATRLATDGRIVCLQNGLCEERVGVVLGDQNKVVGGIVAWGASMIEPGVYDRTSAGGFTLGKVDGGDDATLDTIATLLETTGPVQRTDNLTGARWSKLALNCAITALGAISGERLGVLVRRRPVRRLALEIMSEVVAVARHLDVNLEKVSGTLDLEWIALTDAERTQTGSVALASKHALLLAVGLRYRRLRSSMLRAIERGRPPAVDFLNGEVVARARRHEIATPVNDAVVERIWRIAGGATSSSRALVDELFDATRV